MTLFRDVCLGVQALADYKNRAGESIPWAHRDIKPAYVLQLIGMAMCEE